MERIAASIDIKRNLTTEEITLIGSRETVKTFLEAMKANLKVS